GGRGPLANGEPGDRARWISDDERCPAFRNRYLSGLRYAEPTTALLVSAHQGRSAMDLPWRKATVRLRVWALTRTAIGWFSSRLSRSGSEGAMPMADELRMALVEVFARLALN